MGLVWLRPDREGLSSALQGYQVQMRSGEDQPWAPAHADLIPPEDTQCTGQPLFSPPWNTNYLAQRGWGWGIHSHPIRAQPPSSASQLSQASYNASSAPQ